VTRRSRRGAARACSCAAEGSPNRLSRAALVFKSHALAAAGLDPVSIAPTETFGTTCAPNVIAPDLDAAG
jgi:hypothetical protein